MAQTVIAHTEDMGGPSAHLLLLYLKKNVSHFAKGCCTKNKKKIKNKKKTLELSQSSQPESTFQINVFIYFVK